MVFRLGNAAQVDATNKPASAATDFQLGSAVTGRQTIVAAIGSGNSSAFRAEKIDANGNPAGAWELFIGVVTSGAPNTLTRATLIQSSTGAFIDWSATGENASPRISCVVDAIRLPCVVAVAKATTNLTALAIENFAFLPGHTYRLVGEKLNGRTDQVTTGNLWLRLRRAGQGSYDAGTNYLYQHIGRTSSGYVTDGSAGAAAVQLSQANLYMPGNASYTQQDRVWFDFTIRLAGEAEYTSISGLVANAVSGGSRYSGALEILHKQAAALDGIQVYAASSETDGIGIGRLILWDLGDYAP
ncbi:MAG: hypothetical protein IT495_17040 [Gammaproteobacteria bacterium]|nr:hypothetical protein [Gammaproteobacteria bacterium]